MATDQIILSGMHFYGYHGVNPEEKIHGQKYMADVTISSDVSTAGKTDNLEDTINYSHVYKLIKSIVEGPSQNLIETVAELIAKVILSETTAHEVTVKVSKLNPPIKESHIESAAIQITRKQSDHLQ